MKCRFNFLIAAFCSAILFPMFGFGQLDTGTSPAGVQISYNGPLFDSKLLFGRLSKSLVPNLAEFPANTAFLALDTTQLRLLIEQHPSSISLDFVFRGDTLRVDLDQTQITTDDFFVETSDSGGEGVEFSLGLHYQGKVRDDDKSIAAFSFFEGEAMGLIADLEHGNLVLGRSSAPGFSDSYVLYSDHDLALPDGFVACHTDDEEDGGENIEGIDQAGRMVQNGCVRIFVETDYALFQNKGGFQTTLNYAAGIFNQVKTLYSNDQVTIKLSHLFVWVTPDGYNATSSATLLSQFSARRTVFNGELAQLFSLAGGNNGIGGRANILSNLCSKGYGVNGIHTSYSNVPTYSWTVMVVTHEMGHNLSSRHTHWCGWAGGAIDNCYAVEPFNGASCPPGPAPTNGGTIMSYCHLVANVGINLSNGFGPQPKTKIQTFVAAANCLSSTCNVAGTVTHPTDFNNGQAGLMFDVKNLATFPITLKEFKMPFEAGTFNMEVYRTKTAASWQGNDTNASAWALYGKQTVTSAGNTSLTAIPAFGILLAPGESCGVYVTANAPAGTLAVRYTGLLGTPGAQRTMQDQNLRVATSPGCGKEYPFATSYISRAYNGTVTYSTSPCVLPCKSPSGINVSNITSSSATVSWAAASGASSYTVFYRAVGTTLWNVKAAAVSPVSLTGLPANTSIEVNVQANCAAGASCRDNGVIFKSAVQCGTPSNLNITTTSPNNATATWSAVSGATSYQVWIKKQTASSWGSPTAVTTASASFSNLIANTTYEVRVATVCGANGSSTNSAAGTFTTPPNPVCNATTIPVASNILPTRARITWTSVANATHYQLSYRPAGGTYIVIDNITSTSRYLTNLTPGTTYNARVRAKCAGNNNYAAWSPTCVFTTPNNVAGPGSENTREILMENATEQRDWDDDPAILITARDNVQVFPNPARTGVQVSVSLEKEAQVSTELTDVMGRSIARQMDVIQNGVFTFDVADLPPGLYLVRVCAPGVSFCEKLVKE